MSKKYKFLVGIFIIFTAFCIYNYSKGLNVIDSKGWYSVNQLNCSCGDETRIHINEDYKVTVYLTGHLDYYDGGVVKNNKWYLYNDSIFVDLYPKRGYLLASYKDGDLIKAKRSKDIFDVSKYKLAKGTFKKYIKDPAWLNNDHEFSVWQFIKISLNTVASKLKIYLNDMLKIYE